MLINNLGFKVLTVNSGTKHVFMLSRYILDKKEKKNMHNATLFPVRVKARSLGRVHKSLWEMTGPNLIKQLKCF